MRPLKWCRECDRCTATVFKPKTVTSVRTSDVDTGNREVRLTLVTGGAHRGSREPEDQGQTHTAVEVSPHLTGRTSPGTPVGSR